MKHAGEQWYVIYFPEIFSTHMRTIPSYVLHHQCGLVIAYYENHGYSKLLSFSTIQKNNAVLEPRIGHFRGLEGFEAKAKNFKTCPRGQERPRGLHFW